MAKKSTQTTEAEATADPFVGDPNLSAAQIEQVRQALGIGPDVPDSDIRSILENDPNARAWINQLGSQPSGGPGGLSGFLQAIPGAAERTLHDIGPGNPVVHSLFRGLYESQPGKDKASKKKGAGGSQQSALQQLAQYLTQNFANQANLAVGQMGNQLASQNQGVTNVVNQELAASGASSGNPAIQAATDAYMKAYSAGEGLNSAAYQGMSNANAGYVANAGLYPIANLLTQSLGSGQYKELPAQVVNSLPASVRNALSNLGITEQPAGTGAGTPIPTTGKANAGSNNIAQIIASLTKNNNPGNTATGLGQSISATGNPSNVTAP